MEHTIELDELKEIARNGYPEWYSLKMMRLKGRLVFKLKVADYPQDNTYMGYRELQEFLGI